MEIQHEGISFYFFDFDDNIMFLSTPIFVLNTVTKQERAVSTGEFANIQPQLGRIGAWEEYAIFDGSFRNFRDIPPDQLAPGQKQYFEADVEQVIGGADRSWQGPSWRFFEYACAMQRPLSIVTARGHSPQTIRAGVHVLFERGLITHEPNYHTIYPVGNSDIRRELGDIHLEMTTPALKRRAIVRTVEAALASHPAEPNLRFGMSDDDPQNVNLIIRAMGSCKKRYPEKRFFVINTHMQEEVKLEIFPVEVPVTGRPAAEASDFLIR